RFERLQLTTLQVNDTAVAHLARSRSDAGRFHDVLLDAAVYPCTPIDHYPVRGVAELPETLDTGNLAMTFPEVEDRIVINRFRPLQIPARAIAVKGGRLSGMVLGL